VFGNNSAEKKESTGPRLSQRSDLRPADLARGAPRFYEAVDRKLGEREFGAGIVARVCAEAFIVAPAIDLEQPTSRSAQQPRSPFRCRA
jgi:hypothetical protein